MRKNFNAQKYNTRMNKIFDIYKKLEKKRERINSIKIAILSLKDWEIQELKSFLTNGL
jgi:hypothetical protein